MPGLGVWKVIPYSSSCCSVSAVFMLTVGGQNIGGGLYSHSLRLGKGFGGFTLLIRWLLSD